MCVHVRCGLNSSSFVGAEREENLIGNDPDKSELSIGLNLS